MPFIEKKLIHYMREKINHYDILIPRHSNGLIEPLCAIYNKRCLRIMERNITKDNLAVNKIFPYLKVGYIKEEEIKLHDPHLNSFFNINYEIDLTKAKLIINDKKKRKSKFK
jgi:molybdopterin-guanine dinucleotide biosynthesis protein A